MPVGGSSVSRSFFGGGGGGAPLLSSSLSHSHFLVGEHMQAQPQQQRMRSVTAAIAASVAAGGVGASPQPAALSASRRRSEDPTLTAPLLGRTSSASFGAVLGGAGGSRRASFEQQQRPAAPPAAAAASPVGPSPLGPPPPAQAAATPADGAFSLAIAKAQAAHDPVLAAAIADTESELIDRAQREQEAADAREEEAGRAEAEASPAEPRGAAPPRGRLSLAARLSAYAGPTAQADVVYGLINAVVGVPAMVSFAAIVFVHPTYKPFLGQLARFSFLSAAVHQLCFAALSSLPFAVGQPQDTGLIVLSAIATSVADFGLQRGLSARVVVATTLAASALATMLVGVGTLGVARLRLAGLVQYVPLPVVGGYLSFVGWFCFAAGLGLGAGVELGPPSSWLGLGSADALPKLAATVAASAAILLVMRRARSPWALPALLASIPLLFHAILLATGTSLAQAQDGGWVIKPPASEDGGGGGGGGGHHHHGGGGADPSAASSSSSLEPFWDLYGLFFPGEGAGLCLPALARQLPRAVALWFIVVFGSSLDVAAIQASTSEPLDFNRELATVGASNIVCAACGGGFTGSFLFSQTVFSMKGGVSGPLHGLIIGGVELLVFLLPVPVVQLLPNFFVGALLAVFGVEITTDWLIHSRSKVTRSEYALLVATFALIVWLGLGEGIAAGAVLCLVYFAVSYTRVNLSASRVLSSRSAAARPLREHRALEDAFAGRMAAVSLSGFVFFGSGVKIMDRVLALAAEMVAADGGGDDKQGGGGAAGAGAVAGGGGGGAGAWAGGADEATPKQHEHLLLLRRVAAGAPRFLLLDFRRVLGVDATAAQTFGALRARLARMGVELVLTRVHGNPTVEHLFAAHGLIAPQENDGGGGGASHAPGGGGAGGGGKKSRPERSVSDGGRALRDSEAAFLAQDGGDLGAAAAAALELEPGPESGYCRHFETLNDAARYAEERFLALARAAGALPAQDQALTLREFLAGHLLNVAADEDEDEDDDDDDEGAANDGGKGGRAAGRPADGKGGGGKGGATLVASADASDADASDRPSFGFAALGGSRRAVDAAAEGIERHSSVARFAPGQVLFDYGAAPDVVYLIMKGQVDVEMRGAGGAQLTAAVAAAAAAAAGAGGGSSAPPAAALVAAAFPAAGAAGPSNLSAAAAPPRHYQCGVGAVVGGTDAVLQRPRTFRATAAAAVETVAVEGGQYRAMARERPAAARALQAILLRDACLGEVYAYEALQRAAD